jgi:hypothetical protein
MGKPWLGNAGAADLLLVSKEYVVTIVSRDRRNAIEIFAQRL